MGTPDLRRYYAWQLDELRRREAMMACLLPDLIEGARLPSVRESLRAILDRSETQLMRLGHLVRECEGTGDGAPGALSDVTSLVTAREMAALAGCTYGWTQLLAERLRRKRDGQVLRRCLEEKADARADLTRLAAELV